MDVKRSFFEDKKMDGKKITEAFQELKKLSIQNNIKEWVLFIPTKKNLKDTTLAQTLGEENAKDLSKRNKLDFKSYLLRLQTMSSFNVYTNCDAVIVIYANQKMMDVVDSNKLHKIVIAVTERKENIKEWIRTWNVDSISEKKSKPELIINKIVKTAVYSIKKKVNKMSRTIHPNDEKCIKDAFRILRANNQFEEINNIRSWFIQKGYDTHVADKIAAHAKKAFELQSKPKKYGEYWAPDIYKQWIKESEKY